MKRETLYLETKLKILLIYTVQEEDGVQTCHTHFVHLLAPELKSGRATREGE